MECKIFCRGLTTILWGTFVTCHGKTPSRCVSNGTFKTCPTGASRCVGHVCNVPWEAPYAVSNGTFKTCPTGASRCVGHVCNVPWEAPSRCVSNGTFKTCPTGASRCVGHVCNVPWKAPLRCVSNGTFKTCPTGASRCVGHVCNVPWEAPSRCVSNGTFKTCPTGASRCVGHVCNVPWESTVTLCLKWHVQNVPRRGPAPLATPRIPATAETPSEYGSASQRIPANRNACPRSAKGHPRPPCQFPLVENQREAQPQSSQWSIRPQCSFQFRSATPSRIPLRGEPADPIRPDTSQWPASPEQTGYRPSRS